MQVCKVLFFLLILLNINKNSGIILKSNFKSAICKVSNETIVNLRSCHVKLSNNSSHLIVNITLPQPLRKPLFLKFDLSIIQKNSLQKFLEIPEFELCDAMKLGNNSSPLIDGVAYLLKKNSFGPILNGCPYFGDIDMDIVIDDSKLPSVFLTGQYKVDILMKRKSHKLFDISVNVEIFSNKKNWF